MAVVEPDGCICCVSDADRRPGEHIDGSSPSTRKGPSKVKSKVLVAIISQPVAQPRRVSSVMKVFRLSEAFQASIAHGLDPGVGPG